jgi:uncharacterized membrane protein HdeD (DUF308 family)
MVAYTEPPDALKELSRAWWLLLVVGLMCLAAGVIVLVQPDISLTTLAVIAGIFLLVDGIYDIVVAIAERVEGRGLVAMIGVLSAIAGIILIRHPFGGVVVLALLVGIWLVCVGAVRLVRTFEVPVSRGWNAFVALIEIVAGIVIVAVPDIGVATLAILVGLAFVLRGVGLCVAAWVLRQVKHGAPAATATP